MRQLVLLEKAIIDRKEKTGKYPKAIVPMALYGMPYKIDEIMAIADKYGIPVVEDAAEGMGSRFNGQVLGTLRQVRRAVVQRQQDDHDFRRWRSCLPQCRRRQ